MNKELGSMSKDDIKIYIQSFLKEFDKNLICTNQVLDSLAVTVIKMIGTRKVVDIQEINNLLVKDSIICFIKQHIPLVDKVSDEVQNSVKRYFEEQLKGFEPVEICRISNHPEDNQLYAVIAIKNGQYACWTSWHQEKKNINYGHYGLKDKETAFSIIEENFNDISNEIEKYGPKKSLVSLETSERSEKAVVIPFINKTRGR